MVGISKAHGDSIPGFMIPVPNLDVSIWSGVPPPSVSLLNITDPIVSAEIGDITTTTSLEGVKVGMLNEEEPGPLLFTCFIRICWCSNYAVYTDSVNSGLPTVEPFHRF
jgi:hypothetical protein